MKPGRDGMNGHRTISELPSPQPITVGMSFNGQRSLNRLWQKKKIPFAERILLQIAMQAGSEVDQCKVATELPKMQ